MSNDFSRFIIRALFFRVSRVLFVILISFSAAANSQEPAPAPAALAEEVSDPPASPSDVSVILSALILATGFVAGAWILRRKS